VRDVPPAGLALAAEPPGPPPTDARRWATAAWDASDGARPDAGADAPPEPAGVDAEKSADPEPAGPALGDFALPVPPTAAAPGTPGVAQSAERSRDVAEQQGCALDPHAAALGATVASR